MRATLKICLWLLLCVVINKEMVEPLFAQTPGKEFNVEGVTEPTQHIAALQGKRWALLVGVADYPSTQGYEIQPLKATVKDVNALAAFLKDPQRGGFDADYVFTLTDKEATRRQILLTFSDIAKRAAPEDMVLFYFSGHGYRPSNGDTTYLIPYDFDLRGVDVSCINFDDLARQIRKMAARKVIVIIDACHAGGVKPVGARASGNTGLVQRYLDAFEQSEGRALLLSSDQSEVSWETEDNGVFTHFLLEGLGGKADTNGDGIITFTETALFVEEAVPAYTREHFPRVQRPTRRYELGQVRGNIPLSINWPHHQAFIQNQQLLFDQRSGAILQASLTGLNQALKEFSLKVIQTSHRKVLNGTALTKQESMLLPEIDALHTDTLTVSDYVGRARVIYNLGLVAPPISQKLIGTLYLEVIPTDARVMVTPIRITAPNPGINTSQPIRIQPGSQRELPTGTYRVVAEKSGYQPASRASIEIRTNTPTRVTLALEPIVKPANPLSTSPTQLTPAGPPRGTAFAASLVVPGLGQYLQGRSNRGWLYMGLAAGAGVAAVWANGRYQGTVDDYVGVQDRLRNGGLTEDEALDLLDQQKGAYDDARSARTLTFATQALFAVIWGINVIDVGVAEFGGQRNRRVAVDARPTTDGGRILVHVPF